MNCLLTGASENTDSRAIYTQWNEKIEQMSKIAKFIFIYVAVVNIIITPILITIVRYFIFGLEEESFYLFYPDT